MADSPGGSTPLTTTLPLAHLPMELVVEILLYTGHARLLWVLGHGMLLWRMPDDAAKAALYALFRDFTRDAKETWPRPLVHWMARHWMPRWLRMVPDHKEEPFAWCYVEFGPEEAQPADDDGGMINLIDFCIFFDLVDLYAWLRPQPTFANDYYTDGRRTIKAAWSQPQPPATPGLCVHPSWRPIWVMQSAIDEVDEPDCLQFSGEIGLALACGSMGVLAHLRAVLGCHDAPPCLLEADFMCGAALKREELYATALLDLMERMRLKDVQVYGALVRWLWEDVRRGGWPGKRRLWELLDSNVRYLGSQKRLVLDVPEKPNPYAHFSCLKQDLAYNIFLEPRFGERSEGRRALMTWLAAALATCVFEPEYYIAELLSCEDFHMSTDEYALLLTLPEPETRLALDLHGEGGSEAAWDAIAACWHAMRPLLERRAAWDAEEARWPPSTTEWWELAKSVPALAAASPDCALGLREFARLRIVTLRLTFFRSPSAKLGKWTVACWLRHGAAFVEERVAEERMLMRGPRSSER
jgi:hypothetical protein